MGLQSIQELRHRMARINVRPVLGMKAEAITRLEPTVPYEKLDIDIDWVELRLGYDAEDLWCLLRVREFLDRLFSWYAAHQNPPFERQIVLTAHPLDSLSGTSSVTATGNILGCGSANLARTAAVSLSISSGIARSLVRRAS